VSGVGSLATAALAGVGEASAQDRLWAALIDGRAWSMQTSGGRSGQITLFADGTGTLNDGPMGLKLKWRAKGEIFCMKPGPMRERCVQMKSVDGGFDGYRDDKIDVSLRRK
jgi:hypothetical protein